MKSAFSFSAPNPKIPNARVMAPKPSRTPAANVDLFGSANRPNRGRITPGVQPNAGRTPMKTATGYMREVEMQTPRLSGATRKRTLGYQNTPARMLPKPRTLKSMAMGK